MFVVDPLYYNFLLCALKKKLRAQPFIVYIFRMKPPSLSQLKRERAALLLAIAVGDGVVALAGAIDPDMSYQAVQGWLKRRVPLDRCASVERATEGRVQCEHLREDYTRLEDRPYRWAA